MIAMGDGDKINVHQPFAAAGNILTTGQHHHVRLAAGRMLFLNVFQHFGQPDLGLRVALLKLAQNGEQPLAWENAVDHQIQPGPGAVSQGGGMGFDIREGLQQRLNLAEQQLACRGQHRTTARWRQQRDAQPFLQQREIIAHRRLAAVGLVRRLREATQLDNFLQQRPLFQRSLVHNPSKK